MAELSKGHVFVPGEVVDPADLNDLVDAATALKGIVMDQPIATPVQVDDSVVFYDLSADNLARCKISALPNGVTTVSATIDSGASVLSFSVATPSTTPAFHIGLDNQTGNKVLASPADGSSDTPAFRVLSPADLPVATVSIAAAAIDWSLGSMFTKTLAGNIIFTFSNATAGQTIRVRVVQDASHTVTWPVIRWPGGTTPVMTTGANRVDIYTFHFISGFYYGTFDQDFLL